MMGFALGVPLGAAGAALVAWLRQRTTEDVVAICQRQIRELEDDLATETAHRLRLQQANLTLEATIERHRERLASQTIRVTRVGQA